MFIEAAKTTGNGVLQIILLAAVGYVLVRKNIVSGAGLDTLSKMVVEVTLPLLIFSQLVGDFSFSLYPKWWVFPLLSIVITAFALVLGFLFSPFIRGGDKRMQFISLITFQNSGYLPLALIASVFSKQQADTMLVYLFLFLMGFNLVMWSLGPFMLAFSRSRRFELGSFFSPPVVATLAALIVVWLGLAKFLPDFVFKPMKIVGECTLPLALMVVGGSLASLKLGSIDIKAIGLAVLVKLLVLPVLGICAVSLFHFPEYIGFFIVMQLAMPPATSLSVLVRHYKKEDLLIGQGIFYAHLAGIATIPLFLSFYLSATHILK